MITVVCINLAGEVAKMNGSGRNIMDKCNLQLLMGQLVQGASRLFLLW